MKYKKILTLMLCLSCCILTACNTVSQQPQDTRDTSDTDNLENNTPIENNHAVYDQPMGELPLLTLSSFEDYSKFIRSTELPDNFIYYDTLSDLGVFEGFVCMTDARYGDYSHCLYSVIDSSGYGLDIYIDNRKSLPYAPTEATVITEINAEDMRLSPKISKGKYTKDGIQYNYINNKLLSISWNINQTEITLCSFNDDGALLSKYPLNAQTLLAKLLNANTAKSVVQAISNKHTVS